MIRPSAFPLFIALLGLATPAVAQSPLTLAEAVSRARAKNPEAGRSAAAEREAQQRVTQARASYLPKVDWAESWQRGNQPVFVFSSLLAQRRFAGDAVLNHPDALDNFRTAVTFEQPLFDATARASVTGARLARDLAAANRTLVDLDLAARVTATYGRVLIGAAVAHSAAAAVETARADREWASNRRDAGLLTDADVLQLDVYIARTRERQIRAASEERIARAELNQLMGEPLNSSFVLDPLPPLPDTTAIDSVALAALEAEALLNRPDVKRAALQEQIAGAAQTAARGVFLPQVSAQTSWEANGGAWNSRASSWTVGAVARINVFNGFADRARLAAAREQATARAFDRERAETAARLEVYVAVAGLEAARASELVGRAAVAQAQESRRIIRDRYEAGLTDVASLLRANEAVTQAQTQEVTARVAVLTEAAALERTLGRR